MLKDVVLSQHFCVLLLKTLDLLFEVLDFAGAPFVDVACWLAVLLDLLGRRVYL